jgi:hypothetical protein
MILNNNKLRLEIEYVPNILTTKKYISKKDISKKYTLPKKTLEEFVNISSQASEEIFFFKIPKESTCIKIHDEEEYKAINIQNEINKFAGFGFSESLLTRLEAVSYREGEYKPSYKNNNLKHVLTVIKPETDSFFEYFQFLQKILHEMGHVVQNEYAKRNNIEAKKQIEFAKEFAYADSLLEKIHSKNYDKTTILKINSLDDRFMEKLKLQAFHPEKDLRKEVLKLNKKLANNYYLKKENPELSNLLNQLANSINTENTETKNNKEETNIKELKIELYKSAQNLKKIKGNFNKMSIFNDEVISEGWAQYFSFKIIDFLVQKTEFFNENELENVFNAKYDLFKELTLNSSIYGRGYRFFGTRETRGATPIELAGKIGIKQGLYSTLY